jgi:hypothetical protein
MPILHLTKPIIPRFIPSPRRFFLNGPNRQWPTSDQPAILPSLPGGRSTVAPSVTSPRSAAPSPLPSSVEALARLVARNLHKSQPPVRMDQKCWLFWSWECWKIRMEYWSNINGILDNWIITDYYYNKLESPACLLGYGVQWKNWNCTLRYLTSIALWEATRGKHVSSGC